jgi:hypothetical protein
MKSVRRKMKVVSLPAQAGKTEIRKWNYTNIQLYKYTNIQIFNYLIIRLVAINLFRTLPNNAKLNWLHYHGLFTNSINTINMVLFKK